jgi:tungstate transport system substrate-binding protein
MSKIGFDPHRRTFLGLTAAAGMLGAVGCSKRESKGESAATEPLPIRVDETRVRVASVTTAVEGGVLPALIAQFEQRSGARIEVTAIDDVYDLARSGRADLVISHYGHKKAEAFVLDGLGEWPRTLFSNQMALIGPKRDQARVRGLDDAAEAFRRIAETKSPFVVNDIDGVRYLTDILWHAAGRPAREGWFLDDRQHRKEDALRHAESKQAYVFWGLTPFLRSKSDALEPLVLGDPLLQRMLVSIVVKPSKTPGVNVVGATAFESFLLEPSTQALIRTVRYPGEPRALWIPGGRHNRTAVLPKAKT